MNPNSIKALDNMKNILTVINTAPRKIDYLPKTLRSIFRAGFQNVTVFSEPGCNVPVNVDWKPNPKLLGAWHSFKQAISETVWWSQESQHEYVAYFQDDVTIHPEALDLLSKVLPNLGKFGYLSLYTPTHYNEKAGREIKNPGMSVMHIPAAYGACALVFRLDVLKQFAETNVWNNWLGVPALHNTEEEFEKRRQDSTRIKHVDAGITKIIKELELPAIYFHPSLVQHIGEVSSLGHAPSPIQFEKRSRRIAQHIVDFDKPLFNQVFKSDEQFRSISELV